MIPSCPTLTLISTHTISLLLVSVLLIQLWKIWRRPATVAHLPPGSCGLPLIGETLSFLAANNSSRGFYAFVQARRLRYGSCFKTSIFGKTHVFVSSTGAAKAVLGNDFVGFTKRYIRSIAELLGEQSLLCASVENHRHLRHSMSGLFNLETLMSSVRMFDGLTVEAMSKWKPGETVVVYKDALKITFRAICKMLMNLDREDELDEMQGGVFEVTEAMLAFPLKLPGTRFFRGLKARKRVMSKLREIIRLRREGIECHEDFLQSLLMKAECSSDDSLTDSQIQDNILTLIIAGQITTASAMTWMVKYLDENQEVQEKLRELHLRLACSSPKMSLGPEAFSEMPYGSKVSMHSIPWKKNP
uniref:Cytochrome P450 720B2 n=1 Tax=Anthurium amnicola TaxID=1678845 RepID=A0A1D1Z9E1_9ARAE